MADCVSIQPDNSLLANSSSSCDYLLLTIQEVDNLNTQLQNSAESLAADSPEVQALLASIIGLLALAWVFREIVNFIFNKR